MGKTITQMHLDEFERYGWGGLAHLPLGIAELKHICGLYHNYWSCNPNDPGPYHAEWPSGLHSADFFNLADTLRASFVLCNLLAHQMVRLYRITTQKVFTAVVGSATGSTVLAKAIAAQTRVRLIELTKDEKGEQIWKKGQPPLRASDILLHIEELTSTFSTPLRVQEGVESFHTNLPIPKTVEWSPSLIIAVDRRPAHENHITPTTSRSCAVMLTQFPSRLYKPDACPMCRAGSTAIRARGNDGANWELLTRTT